MLTMKEVPAEILKQWSNEFEVWFKNVYNPQFKEVDSCDYMDERQAFFAEKLGEYSCEGE